ncbi:MAG: ABC transporter permease [Anaerolineales bacterium]|nr:MAG: ABC transporter permease [Anaerolineales bacterium]
MTAWSIAFKDIQILLKDRGALFQLILLPLIFILVIAGAFSGTDSDIEDIRIPLPVANLDGGARAQVLIDGIDDAGGVRTEVMEAEEAQAQLVAGDIQRLLTIPSAFSSKLDQDTPVTLRLTNQSDADPEETEAVRLVVEGVAQDMALENQILASLRQMADMQANAPREFQLAFSVDRIQDQARDQFESSRTRPLVTVEQRVPQRGDEQEREPSFAQTSVPGFTVLFVFLAAQNTARSIYDEKKGGSFRRLMAAPISKASLLIGKVLPNFILALIQFGIIFLFGSVVLGWFGFTPISLGSDGLALILAAIVIAFCSSAMGILIASLAHTEGQIGGLSSLLLWGLAIVGGSIIPTFIMDRILGPLPKIAPHYWANRALNDVMLRNLTLLDVLPEMGILLGFAALFIVIGLWRFDFE